MGKIAIVTDSSACVPKELAKKYDIHIVPILLNLDQQTFRDEVDITTTEVYRLLQKNKHLPTTSAPSVGDFLRVYAKLSEEVESIVSIHLPEELSAIYSTAVAATRLIDGARIEVVDSRTAAMGQGFVVLEAARAAAAGADIEGVLRRIKEIVPRINLFAVIDTFKYLQRSGRVPVIAALMGSLL
ncbi:MAG TPA: DegV family protein, partial [Anaerolineae bacterium]|nr:DegV family protein [Anaerolineae bacterium]